jgi:hypothetical protein
MLAPADANATQGLTVCASDSGGEPIVSVRLAALEEAGLRAPFAMTMRTSPVPVPLRDLAVWECHCVLERRGVSERGEVVFGVLCPRMDVPRRSMILVRDGFVEQIISSN